MQPTRPAVPQGELQAFATYNVGANTDSFKRGKSRNAQEGYTICVNKLGADLHKLQTCAHVIALQDVAPSWFKQIKEVIMYSKRTG